MKNLFIAALVMTGVSVFANNEEKPKANEKSKTAVSTTVCCVKSFTGYGGAASTVRACVPYTGNSSRDKTLACAVATILADANQQIVNQLP